MTCTNIYTRYHERPPRYYLARGSEKGLCMKNLTFGFVPGLCGSGKTYQLIREANRLASNGEKVLIVNASLLKNEQDQRDIQLLNPQYIYNRIDSHHNSHSCKSITDQISDKFKSADPDKGEVLIVTQEGFRNVDYFHCPEKWIVLWDESTDITVHINECLIPDHKERYIFPLIEHNSDEDFSKIIVPEDRKELLLDYINNEDAVYQKVMKNIYQELLNCLEGKCDIYIQQSKNLVMTSIYNPSIFDEFKNVIFFGALFDRTLMYQHFKAHGRNFKEIKRITDKLLFDKHWKPINIHYGFTNGNQSKTFLGKVVDNGTLLNHYKDVVFNHENFPKDETLIILNKGDERDGGYRRLPFNSQGLRNFKEYHNLIYATAYNKDPSFYRLIDHFGYEDKESALHLYQTTLRSSYRDQNCNVLNNVTVPCLKLFQKIADVFPNTTLNSLGLEHIESKVPDNRKKEFSFAEEVYENVPRELKKAFNKVISKRNKKHVADVFEQHGYKFSTIEIIDKWKHKTTKEVWHLKAFPDAIADYCKKRGWVLS